MSEGMKLDPFILCCNIPGGIATEYHIVLHSTRGALPLVTCTANSSKSGGPFPLVTHWHPVLPGGGIFHWWHTLHDTCPISSLIYLHQETSPQLPHVPFRRDLSLPLEAIYCTRTYSTSSEILFQVRNAVRRDDKYSVITGVRFLTLVCLINLCVRHVY